MNGLWNVPFDERPVLLAFYGNLFWNAFNYLNFVITTALIAYLKAFYGPYVLAIAKSDPSFSPYLDLYLMFINTLGLAFDIAIFKELSSDCLGKTGNGLSDFILIFVCDPLFYLVSVNYK